MKILVTGAAGFIGTAVCQRLSSEGHHVVGADLNPPPASVSRAVQGDLRQPEVLEDALTADTAAIIHLAAATSVLLSKKDPANVYRTNVALTQDILERSRLLAVKRMVFASTNAVVGTGAAGGVIDEGSTLVPLTPYGATKAAAEMIMSAYRHSYGLETTAIRLTNVYGPGMSVKDTMVARIMKAARAGTAITIYGDGDLSRDYVYIDDVVDAFVDGATADEALPATVVVGSGTSVNVKELHRLACEAIGMDIPAEHIEGPAGEMKTVVVNRSRADARWARRPVSLSDGLAATWRAWPA